MKSLLDLGLAALGRAKDDPFGRFMVRAMRPLAQEGLDEAQGAVNRTIERIRRGLGADDEPTPVRRPRKTHVVVEAEFVETKDK